MPDPLTASPPAGAARAAFARVFNLRMVAAIFYFCVLVVLGRTLTDLWGEPLDVWFNNTLRFLRQNLISGFSLLLAVALVDALAVARRWSRRRALLAGALATAVAAGLATVVRVWVFAGLRWSTADLEPHYLIGVWSSWVLLGGLGYAVFYLLREDHEGQLALQRAETAHQSLQAQMVQAHLSALQAQIEPHFLFNTLANVKRLYEVAPARGRDMLGSLIDYLRAALPSMRSSGSTLGRELELARAFLTILQMRMGDRLRFVIEADPALAQTAVPPMVLPTLVENAVKHGIAPLPEGGLIEVLARRAGDALELVVRDTGLGIRGSSGSGVGLANTRSRLAALYGGRASLSLDNAQPRGVLATVRLPLEPA